MEEEEKETTTTTEEEVVGPEGQLAGAWGDSAMLLASSSGAVSRAVAGGCGGHGAGARTVEACGFPGECRWARQPP